MAGPLPRVQVREQQVVVVVVLDSRKRLRNPSCTMVDDGHNCCDGSRIVCLIPTHKHTHTHDTSCGALVVDGSSLSCFRARQQNEMSLRLGLHVWSPLPLT